MIINEAGEYTLQYTATDACGNTTVVNRELTVDAPRTVIYADGTLIINEMSTDIDANIALHGQPTNIYAPLNPNGLQASERYEFLNDSERPWGGVTSTIQSVEIGSKIFPKSTAFWFQNLTNCTSMNLEKMDTSDVVDMQYMFYKCTNLSNVDFTNFDTSLVETMTYMFALCNSLMELDLSSFNTSSVLDMSQMFRQSKMQKIYTSNNFVVNQVTNSIGMFWGMTTNLVGGAGTRWASSNPTDKTYAHIDGGTSDPGYFTARS